MQPKKKSPLQNKCILHVSSEWLLLHLSNSFRYSVSHYRKSVSPPSGSHVLSQSGRCLKAARSAHEKHEEVCSVFIFFVCLIQLALTTHLKESCCNMTITHQHSSKEIQLELLSDTFDHDKYSWRVDYSVTPPRTVNDYSILCLFHLRWPHFLAHLPY